MKVLALILLQNPGGSNNLLFDPVIGPKNEKRNLEKKENTQFPTMKKKNRSSKKFVSPYHSVPVPDPEGKGRVARKIPKKSLPLLSRDLTYILVPNAQQKVFDLAIKPGEKTLKIEVPLFYTLSDMLVYERSIVASQKWIQSVQNNFNQEKESPASLNERFNSPYHSVPVQDPEGKGRVARKIPKKSLPILSTDLTYVIVPHARRKTFTLALYFGQTLEVRTPLSYTSSDMLEYEKCIISNQEWISRLYKEFQSLEKESSKSLNEPFVSLFHSVPVPDPEGKGRVARKIPKESLPLLSADLTYVIVPHARRKKFTLVQKLGQTLEVRTPLSYTSSDMLTYEKFIFSNQKWISQSQEKSSPHTMSGPFVSPFHSVPVPDPANKGRIARQIPKESLPLFSRDLTYVIAPNTRRTDFGLVMKHGKILEVRTPLSYTSSDMLEYEKYIVASQEWLSRAHEKQQNREKNSPESLNETFPEREYILYLGIKYPFHIKSHNTSEQSWVTLENNRFEFRTRTNDPEELIQTLLTWYYQRAEEILPPLVKKYAAIMKLPVPELIYYYAKSCWGMCYPTKNRIRFNILVLKIPPDCLEYLVVHELCHFFVSGHKKNYWANVASFMPDYEIRRKKLGTYLTVL